MAHHWLTDVAKDLAELGSRVLVLTAGTALSLLAAIALGAFSKPAGVCRMPAATRVSCDLEGITGAILWNAQHYGGRPPDTLEVLLTSPRGQGWLSCASMPLDPWGREYVYEPPRDGSNSFRVYTLGEDGLPGGTGEDTDIEWPALSR